MLVALLFAIGVPSADYHWPLDLPRQLSSSFGEYRSGRLHAGIDLRTAGTGRAVYAAETGRVTRVRCSPYGYGKAVYVQFLDGNTAVYAHLESFAEPIGEYVRRAQHAQRNYTVDLYPGDAELRVDRGQVIALSGQTGVGVPHLHYEIRDSAGRPINPRDLGIDWPDTTPPVIQAVLIAPLSIDSRVNGDVVPVVIPVRDMGAGAYEIDPVRARGRVGFGLQLVDPANGGVSKLGVRTLALSVGDSERFRMTRDRLSYDTLNNGLVSYHPYLYDRGRFLLAWRWPGNRSEAYAFAGGDGRVDATATAGMVQLTAADFHENAASATFELMPNGAEMALQGTGDSVGTGTFSVSCYGDFLVLSCEFSLPEHDPPVLSADGGAGSFFRVNDKTFRAAIAPVDRADELSISATHTRAESYAASFQVFRRSGRARSITANKARLNVAPESPYSTLYLRMDEPRRVPDHKGLEMISRPFEIWPDNAPIDANVELTIALPDGETRQNQLDIYRANRNGWSRMSSTQTGGALQVSTGTLGTFAIFADETPPAIGPPKISGSLPRPRIEIPVRDDASGIDRYEVTCGDDWLLTAYDPEQHTLEWERDRDLPAGAASVHVVVTDSGGNSVVRDYPLP